MENQTARQQALESALAQVEKAFGKQSVADETAIVPQRESTRTLANRRNAQLSTGPASEEGKARSSKNATKHGLTAATCFESSEEFIEFQRDMVQHYRPFGPLEAVLVERLVTVYWRLRRVPFFEAGMMDVNSRNGAAPDWAFAGNHGGMRFITLSRYETALERSAQRTLEQLERLQDARAPRTLDGMINALVNDLANPPI